MNIKNKFKITDFPLIIIILEILFIIYMNTLKCAAYPELDMAKLYRHAIEMVRNGSIVIDGWNYITTMELDCSLLLALPFYAVTNNIYISFGLANIIFMLIYVYIFYDILRKLSVRTIYKYVAVILLLIPYRMGMLEYFNMMFYNGGQYVIKVLVPLILIDLVLEDENALYKPKNIVLMVMMAFFMAITSMSSGSYVLISGILPVMLGYALNILMSGNLANIRVKKLALFGIIFAAFIAGYIMCIALNVHPNSEGMDLVAPNALVENIFVTIWGYFSVFLSNDSVGVLSVSGINQLIRYAIAGIIILVVIYNIRNMFKPGEEEDKKRILIMPFVITLIILCLTRVCFSDVYYPERYFFIGVIPMFLTVPYFLDAIEKNAVNNLTGNVYVGLIAVAILVLIPMCVFDVRAEIRNGYEGGYRGVYEVMDYARENGIENVFWLYNLPDGEVARLVEPDIRSTVINFKDEEAVLDEVRDFYLAANSPSYYTGANLLLEKSGSGDFERMQDNVKASYTEIGVIGGYVAYLSDACVFDSMN